MLRLPVDDALPALITALRERRCAVLEAPPGAGKTTRAPVAMLRAGLAGENKVVVLEPRRLAARMAAKRVAEEMNERLGETVGYQVRFDDVSSARTRIRFVTEGILTRRLVSDPTLRGVGAVLLDEFHERHLHGDLALAMLRRLQRTTRPDLCVAAMSATLDGESVARFLGDDGDPAPRVRSEGRRFEVTLQHSPAKDDRPLSAQVASAVRALCDEGLDGDVLVFLPGAAEIRKAMGACTAVAQQHDLLVLPLHGELPPAEQDRAVLPAPKRKVILSTNVAETSVTIDGVVAVIDSGLARIAGHAAWSGLPTLREGRVSKASALQRAGRAGRTRPGRCVRLYTKHDHDTRPEFERAEVLRLDLAETALALHTAGERDLHAFPWFEAPPRASVEAADGLLRQLGAVTPEGAVTAEGRRMARLPLHPRLARLVLDATARGVGEDGCIVAALLGERELDTSRRGPGGGRGGPSEHGLSDLTASLARFREAAAQRFDHESLRYLGIDAGAALAVDRARKQVERALRESRGGDTPRSPGDGDEALRMSVLAAFPDRVARRVRGSELALVSGGAATLSPQSEVQDAAFLVAVDAEDRADARSRGVVVRAASAIEPEWLLELFPGAIREGVETRWIAAEERVEAVARIAYESLVLDETRGPKTPEAQRAVAERLASEALAKGVHHFVDDPDALDRFVARVQFVAARSTAVRPFDDARVAEALRGLCEGRRSFAELRSAGLLGALHDDLAAKERGLIERLAPERVTLGGGRAVRVNYERTKAPWIESRLQDFFGMAEGPKVGEVPLVLHLLAPNKRAVQVTTDLAGFWVRHYPAIRKELCRQYPRHLWPEDGRTAAPPPPNRIR
jgi:ATP-dependent helicase HrpB